MHRYTISASRGLVEFLPRDHLQQACRYTGNASSGAKASEEFEDACWIVQFIHESVREHLLSGGLVELCSGFLPDVEGRGHILLARWYQVYMRSFCPTLTPFPVDPIRGVMLHDDHISKEAIKYFRNSNSFAFFKRALTSTFPHVRIARRRGQLCTSALQGFPVIQWVNMKKVEFAMHVDSWKELRPPFSGFLHRWGPNLNSFQSTTSLLYVLMSECCEDLAMVLCKHYPTVLTSCESDHSDLEVQNIEAGPQPHPLASESLNIVCGGYYGSPLGAAVGTASIDMIKLLLDCGADINYDADPVGSPLHIAIRNRNVEIVQLLLSRGRNVSVPSRLHDSCLRVAVDTCNALEYNSIPADSSKSRHPDFEIMRLSLACPLQTRHSIYLYVPFCFCGHLSSTTSLPVSLNSQVSCAGTSTSNLYDPGYKIWFPLSSCLASEPRVMFSCAI